MDLTRIRTIAGMHANVIHIHDSLYISNTIHSYADTGSSYNTLQHLLKKLC